MPEKVRRVAKHAWRLMFGKNMPFYGTKHPKNSSFQSCLWVLVCWVSLYIVAVGLQNFLGTQMDRNKYFLQYYVRTMPAKVRTVFKPVSRAILG